MKVGSGGNLGLSREDLRNCVSFMVKLSFKMRGGSLGQTNKRHLLRVC